MTNLIQPKASLPLQREEHNFSTSLFQPFWHQTSEIFKRISTIFNDAALYCNSNKSVSKPIGTKNTPSVPLRRTKTNPILFRFSMLLIGIGVAGLAYRVFPADKKIALLNRLKHLLDDLHRVAFHSFFKDQTSVCGSLRERVRMGELNFVYTHQGHCFYKLKTSSEFFKDLKARLPNASSLSNLKNYLPDQKSLIAFSQHLKARLPNASSLSNLKNYLPDQKSLIAFSQHLKARLPNASSLSNLKNYLPDQKSLIEFSQRLKAQLPNAPSLPNPKTYFVSIIKT